MNNALLKMRSVALFGMTLAAAQMLSACGGGGKDGAASTAADTGTPAAPGGTQFTNSEKPATRADAVRFLRQATFGPGSDAEIDRLMSIGYDKWFD